MVSNAWKIAGKTKGAFEPIILKKPAVKNFCAQNINRLLISACDIAYLEENIDSLISYEKSDALIPYIAFVFCESSDQEAELRIAIQEINKQVNSSKILLELFTCNAMIKIKLDLCANSYKEYLVNYIKCARFCLVSDVWKQLGIYHLEKDISQFSTYVMDFDNFVARDFNGEIKNSYGGMKAVFCWKGNPSKSDFPKNLNGLTINEHNSDFSYPHKIVKAGFTVLAPSHVSKMFLMMFKEICLGPDLSITTHRLFSFYYADQLSTLMALREIKDNLPTLYTDHVGWIDCISSEVVNLSKSQHPAIWMPKGINPTTLIDC